MHIAQAADADLSDDLGGFRCAVQERRTSGERRDYTEFQGERAIGSVG